MKNILIAVMFVFAATSLTSAELLTTANPIRKGKWAFSLSAVQNSNASNNSNYSIVSSGVGIGYGIDDKLDVYLIGGVSNVNGLPSQLTSSITSYGVIAKYVILGESDGFPISVFILEAKVGPDIPVINPPTPTPNAKGPPEGGATPLIVPGVLLTKAIPNS